MLKALILRVLCQSHSDIKFLLKSHLNFIVSLLLFSVIFWFSSIALHLLFVEISFFRLCFRFALSISSFFSSSFCSLSLFFYSVFLFIFNFCYFRCRFHHACICFCFNWLIDVLFFDCLKSAFDLIQCLNQFR